MSRLRRLSVRLNHLHGFSHSSDDSLLPAPVLVLLGPNWRWDLGMHVLTFSVDVCKLCHRLEILGLPTLVYPSLVPPVCLEALPTAKPFLLFRGFAPSSPATL